MPKLIAPGGMGFSAMGGASELLELSVGTDPGGAYSLRTDSLFATAATAGSVIAGTDPGGTAKLRAASLKVGGASVLNTLVVSTDPGGTENFRMTGSMRVDMGGVGQTRYLFGTSGMLRFRDLGGGNIGFDASNPGETAYTTLILAGSKITLGGTLENGAVVGSADPGGSAFFRVGGSASIAGGLTLQAGGVHVVAGDSSFQNLSTVRLTLNDYILRPNFSYGTNAAPGFDAGINYRLNTQPLGSYETGIQFANSFSESGRAWMNFFVSNSSGAVSNGMTLDWNKGLQVYGGFGCNGNAPQGKYASGGTLAGVVAALIANGTLSN